MSGSTLVFAENPAFARDLAFALYGSKNVVSVVVNEESDQTNESTSSSKPPDPAKQRIQSLRDQAKRYRDMAKQEQARQKIQKANQTLTKINRQPSKPATR
jgi:nucleosome binding factor SPN SPT16 subunit